MNGDTIILGIGNSLNGDDGIGSYIAEKLIDLGFSAHKCETAPENYSSVIRNRHPDTVILIDASLMSLPVGSIRIIPKEKIADTSIGTHMLPLSCFVDYISKFTNKTIIIGIQPESTKTGELISPEVLSAGETLIKILIEGNIDKISIL